MSKPRQLTSENFLKFLLFSYIDVYFLHAGESESTRNVFFKNTLSVESIE